MQRRPAHGGARTDHHAAAALQRRPHTGAHPGISGCMYHVSLDTWVPRPRAMVCRRFRVDSSDRWAQREYA